MMPFVFFIFGMDDAHCALCVGLCSKGGVVSVSSGAVVPKDCTLEGNIHIGEGTVLHPRCKIIAEKGSITIGKYNIIEEHSVIVNSHGTTTI